MKKIIIFTLLTGMLIVGCSSEENETTNNGISDLIAFTQSDPDVVYQMDLDTRDVQVKPSNNVELEKWEDSIKIINNTCGGFSINRFNPVSLISPDGAPLGVIDDSWIPNWSSGGRYIALACGRDDENNVYVVSDTEHLGSSEGWSRTGRGSLSDRMDIIVLTPDGSEIYEVTSNEFGDWLPRWFPKMPDILENKFFKAANWPELLLVESNRDGDSEIYLHITNGVEHWRITENEVQDQSPAWSSKGHAAVFASDKNGSFEISLNFSPLEQKIENTGQVGRPVPWDEK